MAVTLDFYLRIPWRKRLPAFDIDAIRAEIKALDKSIYMNTGGAGPLPNSVSQDIISTYQDVAENGGDIPTTKGPVKDRFEGARQVSADLFGVDSSEIALFRAISEGISTVAYGMDWNQGDEVIISSEEHPTGIIVWLNLAERRGIKIKKLEITLDKEELLSRFSDLLTDRTRLVALSHVTTDTGTRLPAKEMCDLAHAHGIPVILDAAQSAGQFPIDLRDIDVDFYACTGHKWLLGGWGTGIFYVKKEWIPKLQVSWSGSGAGDWNRQTDELVFADSAHRFEFGGRHDPLYSGMSKGIEFVQNVGLENIETQSRSLTDRLKAAISEIDGATLRSPESPEFSTGIVTFSVAGLSGTDLNAQMFERWRILGRPALNHSSMRLSCAFFNSDQEIDTVIDAISALTNENR
jgi:selenocysteine lyase/cysteine desulfurase